MFVLFLASSLWAGNFFAPIPANRSYSGAMGVPTATVISDSQLVLSYGFVSNERRFAGIQSIGSYLELGGMIAGPKEGSGDLSLQARLVYPLWQCQSLRLNVAVGGTDLGGGAVHDRHVYGVTSLDFPYGRFSVGAWDKPDSLLFGAMELAPIPYLHLLLTSEQQGLALVAPNWAVFQVGFDREWKGKSYQMALTRSLDSLMPKPIQRDSSIWNIHYQPAPELFDIVAVETGIYHYQLLLHHNLFFHWRGKWGGALQVRQPLKHSTELNDGHSLAQYRKDSVVVQQSVLYWNAPWRNYTSQFSVGTYETEWWFWRTSLGWSKGNLSSHISLARYDNPNIKEYRVVCVPSMKWDMIPHRYALEIFGGSFWEQDYGAGMSIIKEVGNAKVIFTATRTYPDWNKAPIHLVGASLTVPLRLAKDISLGTPHVTMNGPEEWTYGLRTRLIQPGKPNTVNPYIGKLPQDLVH